MPSDLSRAASIRTIATAFPLAVLENDALLEGATGLYGDLVTRRTGVSQRHIAAEGETALDLGEAACRKLFAEQPDLPSQIDTLIFCTQSPDYVLPPNSCLLHGRLELAESVTAFDLPHACSGYIYALKLAQSLIVSGAAENILLVTADTYTKYLHPQDRSTRLLFGDAGAATWIAPASAERGIRDVVCGTAGQHFETFLIPAGGCRQPVSDALRQQEVRDTTGNVRTPAHIHMAGREVLSFVADRIPPHIREVLAKNQCSLADIDWFVFHQASNVVLDTLISLLDLDPAKVLRHLETVGNTVSASIPITLQHARQNDLIHPGQLVLLCGFGVGLSWGSALVRW